MFLTVNILAWLHRCTTWKEELIKKKKKKPNPVWCARKWKCQSPGALWVQHRAVESSRDGVNVTTHLPPSCSKTMHASMILFLSNRHTHMFSKHLPVLNTHTHTLKYTHTHLWQHVAIIKTATTSVCSNKPKCQTWGKKNKTNQDPVTCMRAEHENQSQWRRSDTVMEVMSLCMGNDLVPSCDQW